MEGLELEDGKARRSRRRATSSYGSTGYARSLGIRPKGVYDNLTIGARD